MLQFLCTQTTLEFCDAKSIMIFLSTQIDVAWDSEILHNSNTMFSFSMATFKKLHYLGWYTLKLPIALWCDINHYFLTCLDQFHFRQRQRCIKLSSRKCFFITFLNLQYLGYFTQKQNTKQRELCVWNMRHGTMIDDSHWERQGILTEGEGSIQLTSLSMVN